MKQNKVLDLLLHSAKGFYDIGINCAYNISNESNGEKFLQRIAPGAVNLIFASELLLKGLYLIISKSHPKGHFIKDLFNGLPANFKTEINDRFIFHKEVLKENKDLVAFRIAVTNKNSKSKSSANSPVTTTLDEVLEAHNKGFESWRYLHEIGEEGYTYEIEFNLLNCFLKALIDVINLQQLEPRLLKDTNFDNIK